MRTFTRPVVYNEVMVRGISAIKANRLYGSSNELVVKYRQFSSRLRDVATRVQRELPYLRCAGDLGNINVFHILLIAAFSL